MIEHFKFKILNRLILTFVKDYSISVICYLRPFLILDRKLLFLGFIL